MPVGGLQRDEARMQAMGGEAVPKAAVGLAGGDSEQPALGFERVEQVEDAIEQRLIDLAGAAQRDERLLVIVGEPGGADPAWRPAGAKPSPRCRLRPIARFADTGRRHRKARSARSWSSARHRLARRCRRACRRSRRSPAVHRRLALSGAPRARRSPRRSRRRALAAAATLRGPPGGWAAFAG